MSNLNPERALISAVLRTQKHQPLLEEMISPDYFDGYVDEAEWLFKYIDRRKRAPSRALFKAEFPDFRLLAVDDVEHYCAEVRKRHSAVLLTETLSNAAEMIHDGEVEKALDIIQRGTVKTYSTIRLHHDSDIIDNWEPLYQDVQERKEKYDTEGFAGIPTGFETVDERTGGLQGGQLGVLAARLGQGKSWSLMRMAVTALMHGKVVQFNALEMHRQEVSKRVHAFLSSSIGRNIFSNTNLAQGKEIDLVEYNKFLRTLRKELNGSGRLHVADASHGQISTMDIESQITRNNPDIVFIDYITLMKMRGEGDWSSLARLTNELKQLASQYRVPIMVAAQLNRNAAGGKEDMPGPEDLARGDSIGQDADLVLFQRLMSDRALKCQCVKNRHGVGNFKYYCVFDPSHGVLQEINKDAFEDIRSEDMVNANK